MGIENPVHLLFIAAVALIVLGPKRLPDLAKALGQGIREFREAMSDGEEERHLAKQEQAAAAAPAQAPPPSVATAQAAPPSVATAQAAPPAAAPSEAATADPPDEPAS